MRGVAAFVVATTLAGGLSAAPAFGKPVVPAADPPVVSTISENATQVTNYQQKLAAASDIDKRISDIEASMSDLKFTVWIYKWAEPGSAIKREADKAMTNFDDELACYNFIVTGIHAALREDILELSKRDKRHVERLKAAAIVGWTDPSTTRLDGPLYDFVLELSEKAENGSEIEAKARAVLTNTSTDEQRQAFVTTGILEADRVDTQRRIEAAEREKREKDEADRALRARAAAWVVAGKAGLTEELKVISDRDFVWKVYNSNLAGRRVKAAAHAALDTADSAKIKAYIFDGVHVAHQADVADENAARAAETEKTIKGIIDAARLDGYMPELDAAATRALAGTLAERNAFIDIGRYDAAKKDQIKPKNNLVIELQGKASGRCVSVAGTYEEALSAGRHNELWDCQRGVKQVWSLSAVNDTEYLLQNMHSAKCLDGYGDLLYQQVCDGNNAHNRWKFIESADGSYQIRNVGNGRFVSAKDGQTPNATHIVSYGNTDDGSQRWRIIDVVHRADVASINVGRYRIKGVQSDRCVQPTGPWSQPNEGANVNFAGQELWDCGAGLTKAKWDLIDLGGKRYALKNVQSGKCLDVKYGSWANGTQLVQYDCHFGGTEQFVFRPTVDGSYILENALTGRVADVTYNAIQNGAWIGMHDSHGMANQRWVLEAA
jgi:hypothetical protein